jgi:hypothetical protein
MQACYEDVAVFLYYRQIVLHVQETTYTGFVLYIVKGILNTASSSQRHGNCNYREL